MESSLHLYMQKISGEVTKIRKQEEDLKRQNEGLIKQIKEQNQGLIKQIKEQNQGLSSELRYVSYGFLEFGAKFIGRGYPGRDECIFTRNISRDECFTLCVKTKEEKGKEWFGFVYSQRDRFCECYKNPTGFNA